MSKELETGTLYLVATPIGNLGDITLRAIEVLKSVDIIAAEDTRHSKILVNNFGIETPLTSYHEHNKYEKAEVLIGELISGKNVAVITDAGTPAISDPGEVLARMCKERGITVTSVPGACALIDALVISGMPARRFIFEGFLPTDKAEREEVLKSLMNESRTVIMYEAPHRLKKTIKLLLDRLGDRRVAFCRELTKIHEESEVMLLSEALTYYEASDPKGEFVLVIEGRDAEELKNEKAEEFEKLSYTEHLDIYLEEGMDKKAAMKKVAEDRNISKRDVYQKLLEEES